MYNINKKKNDIMSKQYFDLTQDKNGLRSEVCKTFFFTTLGFKRTNDKFIRSILHKSGKNSIITMTDGRGK